MHRGQTKTSRITAALCTAAITTAALAQQDIGEVKISNNYSQELNAQALAIPDQDRAWPLYRRALMPKPNSPTTSFSATPDSTGRHARASRAGPSPSRTSRPTSGPSRSSTSPL